MEWVQPVFNLALIVSMGIFIALLGVLIWSLKPYKNFERGIATLVWAFPASVLVTMILVYLDTPYIFLSLFGGPGLSSLAVPPAKSRVYAALGGVMVALSIFITLVTTGVIEMPGE